MKNNKNNKNMCAKCEKVLTCKKLCKEAEKYVDQDNVKQQEFMPPGDDFESSDTTPWGFIFHSDCNVKKLNDIVINLKKDGKSNSEIAYHVPYSKRHIRRLINDYYKDNNIK
jgi:hypothetical protein